MFFGAESNPEWFLVPTTAAAILAHVRTSTIRVWHHRGRITRHGTHVQALWDLREVLAWAERDDDDGRSLDSGQAVTHHSLESE